jgi:enamine deaminase RidA (YjgF/YER057c/UK114 family)
MILEPTYLSNDAGHIAIVECGDHLFITAAVSKAASEDNIRRLFDDIAQTVASRQATPVHERIFGSESFLPFVEEARRDAFLKVALDVSGPVTSVDGAPPLGFGLSGMMMHCIIQPKGCSAPKLVCNSGAAVGKKWQTNRAEFLVIQNIGSDFNPGDTPQEQAKQAFLRMDQSIFAAGFSFHDVVRTWFYLTDILSWYGDFNKVRSAAYRQLGIMPEPGRDLALPSSTGIGCKNSKGRALAADLLLVRPRDGTRPNRILNPAQKEAYKYGAAFSRAVEITLDHASLIEISGTAAIDEHGLSLFPNDAAAQINCTLDKIEVILGRVGGNIRDIASATVFVKPPDIAEIFEQICASRGIEHFPGVIVHADVCRDDLLFEIDAEAFVYGRDATTI